jgi:hypothetical protein
MRADWLIKRAIATALVRPLTSALQYAKRLVQHLMRNRLLFHTGATSIPASELNDNCTLALGPWCKFSLEQIRKSAFVGRYHKLSLVSEMTAKVGKTEHIDVIHGLHGIVEEQERKPCVARGLANRQEV